MSYKANELARNNRPEPLFHSEPTVTRKCLKCDCEFLSRGDRLCQGCNRENRRGGRRNGVGGTKTRAGRECN